MAFDNPELAKLLEVQNEQAEQQTEPLTIQKAIPTEKKKAFPFTLEPSVRKKIDQLAEENGYSSASAFVNATFKNL